MIHDIVCFYILHLYRTLVERLLELVFQAIPSSVVVPFGIWLVQLQQRRTNINNGFCVTWLNFKLRLLNVANETIFARVVLSSCFTYRL